jgi:transposase-like protein
MTIDLTDPVFADEDKAREHLEAVRWPHGPVCPRCGGLDRITKRQGEAYRPGVYHCGACRQQFSVTVGTVMERSKIPLRKWVLATRLMCASKKGMSAHQLHRMLDLPYATAWFMAHRLREGMREARAGVAASGLDCEAKTVEATRPNFGKAENPPPEPPQEVPPAPTKREQTGPAASARSWRWSSAAGTSAASTSSAPPRRRHGDRPHQRQPRERADDDESKLYTKVGEEFASHRTVTHSAGEYVRKDDRSIHTNTIEGYFSIFKRGMRGIYQHCGEQHLHRYLAEFDFPLQHAGSR